MRALWGPLNFLGFIGLPSLFVYGVFQYTQDVDLYSSQFMAEVKPLEELKQKEFRPQRRLASSSMSHSEQESLSLSQKGLIQKSIWMLKSKKSNQETINMERIGKFHFDNNQIKFDQFPRKSFSVSNYKVQSLVLSSYEDGSIVEYEFEKMPGPKTIASSRVPLLKSQAKAQVEKNTDVRDSKYNVEDSLILVAALDPSRNRVVQWFDKVQGEALLKFGELSISGVQLHMGTPQETEESFEIEARVNDFGHFNEEGISGIITRVNDKEVQVRISTGHLSNALLTFATPAHYQTLKDKQNGNPVEHSQVDDSRPEAVKRPKIQYYSKQRPQEEDQDYYVQEEELPEEGYLEAPIELRPVNANQDEQYEDEQELYDEIEEIEENPVEEDPYLDENGYAF